ALVAGLVYGLVSYAMDARSSSLALIGVTIGALLMCKINVGLFAATAIVVGFVVGNGRCVRSWRLIVAIAALALPFVLMFQKLYQISTAQFALVVSLGLLLAYVPMHLDLVTIPSRAIRTIALAALVPILVSVIWPL